MEQTIPTFTDHARGYELNSGKILRDQTFLNLLHDHSQTFHTNPSANEIDYQAKKRAKGARRSYTTHQQEDDEALRQRMSSSRSPSFTFHHKESEDHAMTAASFFDDWPDFCSSADLFCMNQSSVDPIITSSAMEIQSGAREMEALPHQLPRHPKPEPVLGFQNDHDLDAVNKYIQMAASTLSADPLVSTDRTSTSTNSWPHQLGPRSENTIASDGIIAEMLEEYIDDSRGIQAHHLQVSEQPPKSDWPIEADFLAGVNVFQYPTVPTLGAQEYPHCQRSYSDSNQAARDHTVPDHPAPALMQQQVARKHSAPALMQQRVTADRLPRERRSSFTSPTTSWTRWNKKAAAARAKLRNMSSNAAVGRVNQLMVKKMLMSIVPMVAKDQKRRVARVDQFQAIQSTTALQGSWQVDGVSTTEAQTTQFAQSREGSCTTESMHTMHQDPQARTHMLAERRRRVRENQHYETLRSLIPPTSKMDKATVLGETIQLVKRLKKQVRQLETVKTGSKAGAEYAREDAQENPSAASSSDHSPSLGNATRSQGSRRGNDNGCSRLAVESNQAQDLGENPTQIEIAKEELISNGDIPLTTPQPGSQPLPAIGVKGEDDRKELIEVLHLDEGSDSNQLRVEICTLNKPHTLIQILTCFKEECVQVTSNQISMENSWIQARFQLTTSSARHNLPATCTELEGSLRHAIARAPMESNAESHSSGAPSPSQNISGLTLSS